MADKDFRKNGDINQCLLSADYLPEEWKGMKPTQVWFEVNKVNGEDKIVTYIVGVKGDVTKLFAFNMMSTANNIQTIFPTLKGENFYEEKSIESLHKGR